MEFSVSGYRYAYRSGETIADPQKGCELTEATTALACAHGLREAVLAKREIGQLWQNIRSTPYKSLFNPNVSGARVWGAVQLMRQVEEDLRVLREGEFEGRDWLISVHFNRLVLWAVLQHLGPDRLRLATEFGSVYDRQDVRQATNATGRSIVAIVGRDYSDSYPQPLFRNLTKVRDVADRVVASLTP